MFQSIDQACLPARVCSQGLGATLTKPILMPTQKLTPTLLGTTWVGATSDPCVLACDVKAWSHIPSSLCYLLLGIFFIEFIFQRLKTKQWEQI